jgi:hypothetical protein
MVTNRTGPHPRELWPPSRLWPIKPNPLPPSLSPHHPLPCTTTSPPHPPFLPSFLSSLLFVLLSILSSPYPHTCPSTMPDASKPIQKGIAPSHLVALPSLSNSLSSLPQAKSLAHVAVYNSSSMSGQHAAESEAKVCAPSLSSLPRVELCLTETPIPPSLKRHCRTMSGRRKRSRMRLP